MLFYAHQWVLFVLVLLYSYLPRSSSRSVLSSLPSLDSWTDPGLSSAEEKTAISKRTPDADPWGICPLSMRRIDCFYEYLSIYATLRDQMEKSNPRTYRNIGKRSQNNGRWNPPPSSLSDDVLCPTDMNPLDCLLYFYLIENHSD